MRARLRHHHMCTTLRKATGPQLRDRTLAFGQAQLIKFQLARWVYSATCNSVINIEELSASYLGTARPQRCRTLLRSAWYDTTQAANTWYDWTVKTTVCTHLENFRVDRTLFSPADGLTTRRLQASAFGRGEEGPSEAPAIVTAGLVAISVHACFTLY